METKLETLSPSPWLSSYDDHVSPRLVYPEKTLPDFLDDIARQYPDRPAVIYFGSRLTYRQLNEKANQFARVLLKEGLQPGERVALDLPNCPPCVIAYFGALRAGAILTQLNPMHTAEETASQLKDSGARYVVSIDRFAPIFQKVAGDCGLRKVWLTRVQDYFPIPLRWFFHLKARENKTWVHWPKEPLFASFVKELGGASRGPVALTPSPKPDDVALLQYTGGTTGVSKGAILTHRNLVANAYQCHSWFWMLEGGKEVFLVAVPIFHCYGMTVGMNTAIAFGSAMVLLPKFDVAQVLKMVNKYRVGVLPGVQAFYAAINNHSETHRYNVRSIKACISGAGPLHEEVQRRFEALTGGKLVEGYGLTEAGPVTHCNPVMGKRKIGRIGLPLPGTEARIMDLDAGTRTLPPGEAGELVVKGPQVMKGYWNQPEETRTTLRDGWLYTGDIAVMDEDGFFAVVDRKKDMVKVGGENVYPREVEEVLYKNEKVRDCVVAGVPDRKLVDKLKAYIVLNPGAECTRKEIIDFCKARLARYKVPLDVEFRESLPKNQMVGKMLRRVLVEEEKAKLKAKEESKKASKAN
jgi:long-chain acyl-CoA synthetase